MNAAIEPYYDDGQITIYHGDALDVIAALDVTVDAVVTDPPYASGTRLEAAKSSSGAMLRAGRFADRPIDLDQMTTTGFVWLMRAVAIGTRPMLPDGGSFLSFIDWHPDDETRRLIAEKMAGNAGLGAAAVVADADGDTGAAGG
jgi:DNA modification methylase